jgi:hypothetical protein
MTIRIIPDYITHLPLKEIAHNILCLKVNSSIPY